MALQNRHQRIDVVRLNVGKRSIVSLFHCHDDKRLHCAKMVARRRFALGYMTAPAGTAGRFYFRPSPFSFKRISISRSVSWQSSDTLAPDHAGVNVQSPGWPVARTVPPFKLGHLPLLGASAIIKSASSFAHLSSVNTTSFPILYPAALRNLNKESRGATTFREGSIKNTANVGLANSRVEG